ncbi:MAG: FHA domain-containing protein [Planctomycetaceae bacterium]|nr:FHA domain-containing protein [Planctomycetaceae bacterium]
MLDASLLVVQGTDQGNRFPLDVPQLLLGRGSRCDVRISDSEVSREHARLELQENRWHFIDLGSSNGSFINGKTVRSQILEQGDQIQVGRTILLYHSGEEPDQSFVQQRIRLVADPSQEESRIVGTATGNAASRIVQDATASFSGNPQAGSSLQALYRITEAVVSPTTSLDQTLQQILDLTLTTVGADRGCMLVTNSRTDLIEPRTVSHRPEVDVNSRMPISTSIVEYVIQHGRGVRTSDASHDSRFEGGRSILKSGIREAMCVPMQGRYELMGVIYVDTTQRMELLNPNDATRFTDQLLTLLLAIGRQSALAIENHRYQEALVESERLGAMGQTIATMSHHIKNILQGVRGGGYLVDMGLNQQDDPLVRKGWGIVERNLDRIYNLVMDMLQFSKERQPAPKRTDLNALIHDVCELVSSRAEAAGLKIELELDGSLPSSMFDPEGMHRALLNIITNAVDAIDGIPQPRVVIRSGLDHPDQLWVEVEDNGPGVPEEELPKLFELFASTKGSRGTGLGLAVSRKILTEHGGDIVVENSPGTGAKFRLYWPMVLDDDEENESAGDEKTMFSE